MRQLFVPDDIKYLKPAYPREEVDGLGNPIDPLDQMASDIHRLMALRTITTGFTSRVVAIGTTPTLIVSATRDRAYTIINPTPAVGLTTTATFFNSAISVAGNSQLVPVGVSNYDTMHFFASVTNAVGLTLNLIYQVQSPINGNWIDVQDIVPAGITSNGDIYAGLGSFGIVTGFAVRWTIVGSCKLSMGYALKGGLGGSSQGSINTVFLGNRGVNSTTGFPLLEGLSRDYSFLENAEMYGIANQNVNINVVEYT